MLAGAPLGDPADASPRLRDALESADVVAAEDTRRLFRLAADLGVRVPGRVLRHDDATEEAGTPGLVEELRAGRTVLLVTDGGMPSVSDPGYRLVSAAVAAGIPVTAVPGPSAVTDRAGPVRAADATASASRASCRARPASGGAALTELAGRAPDAGLLRGPAPAGRHARRHGRGPRPGPAGRGLPGADQDVRGGAPGHAGGAGRVGRPRAFAARSPWSWPGRRRRVADADPAALAAAVRRREEAGTDRKAAIAEVAQETGLPKRDVYEAVVAAR